MFTWLNKQGVRSDAGFELQFTGRFTVEYRENGRATELYTEGGAGTVSIYAGSLEPMLAGFDGPDERRVEHDRLIRNIREALAFQGLQLDVIAGPEPNY
jgi:hypothetical protein